MNEKSMLGVLVVVPTNEFPLDPGPRVGRISKVGTFGNSDRPRTQVTVRGYHKGAAWLRVTALSVCEPLEDQRVTLTTDQLTIVEEALGDAWAYRIGEAESMDDTDELTEHDRKALRDYDKLADQLGLVVT